MDIDEDDDFYAPEESASVKAEGKPAETISQTTAKPTDDDEDLEEGEEEDEGDSEGSSDIDIITERKDGSKAASSTQPKYNEIRNIPQRTTSSDVPMKAPIAKKESKASKEASSSSGANLPGLSTSKIDVDAKPLYEPAGKPITQVNIDQDLNENDKPWRRPGTDVSDYFNYGFDEFTWALYAAKQESLRSEFDPDKIAQNNKKMFEEMNMMMNMGGMPGMPGMPAGAGGAQMPAMEGMPAEMQAMMQQMMASGMDPSQMDPMMFAGMQGNQAGAGAAGGAQGGTQGQGFGQAGFGQGQQGDYGHNQGGGGGGGQGGGRGNFGGGRGRRGRGGGGW
ncbi:Fip1 motif-domain-containing protein [Tricladium varicosporioides]|nr:Fip1 motif-domain-containing protein [Hymenoscyphus varicosporioides]